MKIRSGYIPLDVVYIFGGTQRVTHRWDEADQPEEELVYTEVTPAFVSDADNPKTIETGTRWAKTTCSKYNPNTKTTEVIGTVQKLKRENDAISGLRVIGLEYRGEGGRAYKVVTKDGFYFDLREDVLLDTMLAGGIGPGGIISGEFRWARVGTEMKLVRIGSELYSALVEAGERTILASIPKKKFRVGTIYENKRGERAIFLGFITTESWQLQWPNNRSTFSNNYMATSSKPTLKSKTLNRHMLWFEVNYYYLKGAKNDPTEQMFKDALVNPEYLHNFKLKSSQSVIREVGQVEVPSDVVELLRQKALRQYTKNLEKTLNYMKSFANYMQKYQLESVVVAASSTLLMRDVGKPKPQVDDSVFRNLESLIDKVVP